MLKPAAIRDVLARCSPQLAQNPERLILTEVEDAPTADAFFPPFAASEWRETERERHLAVNGPAYSFVTYQRIR